MKQKIILLFLTCMLLFGFAMPALAEEGNALHIDSMQVYPGMAVSYANGYVPTVIGSQAHVILPLMGSVPGDTITVTPVLPKDGPFVQGNYEFVVNEANGVFLIDRSFPLKSNRINGAYAITFQIRYANAQNILSVTQSFPVYVTIKDGIDPDYEPPTSPEPTPMPTPVVGQLRIDSGTIYDGMGKSYARGYVPTVKNGTATIILPLIGVTYNGEVTLTADLGKVENNPFILGNYSQTIYGRGLYVFKLDIPLAGDRFNGSYPVVLQADYLDVSGTKAKQSFTVHVTITDGKNPPDPNATPQPEAVDKPELFISACKITPDTVSGNEEFTVQATIENIGAIRARSVTLTYGSEAEGIVPVETVSAMLLDNIASEESTTATFKLKTTKDVLAGNRPFYVKLDYVDLYGGVYTATRQFLIAVTQPAAISYDPVSLPKEITAGETVTLPANVFNIGKSILRNVTITLTGAGLFPTSSVFLGDVPPGEAGNGEMKVFAGMLSMTEGYTESYGKTSGKYTISYQDDFEETYIIELDVSTEIKKPVIEGEKDKKEEDTASQWWISILVGFAIIAIIITVIVVSKFTRTMKIGR